MLYQPLTLELYRQKTTLLSVLPGRRVDRSDAEPRPHAGCINVAKAVSMLTATIAPASDTQTTSTLHRALDGRGFAMRHPTFDWPTRL
ncbi:uncharacterized protein PAN0_015c5167 [Moesziomyces antarcticus]|uniref:Uncharacterized protein n=1 Tax=Pseudozyma antarctica TaxID=84753 RepID=A0A081CJU6_PSEA2|nr:uncharacterized protein PAN0_015c5167 [Moesziomyces antarcticus]GAK66942.1 hypothetical protein PAN0_015c5167 [Moesziomyces antarcticus]